MVFIGVDGFKKVWVAVAITEMGFDGAGAFPTFADLVEHYPNAKVIGVDMPLRLVEEGDRDADQAARDFLRGQSSSVFNAPPRRVLAAKTYEAAQDISQDINAKGISKQSFALAPKILELQNLVDDKRVYEVHPEVSFRLLYDEKRIPHSKKTWGGLHTRLALLKSAGIDLPPHLDGVNQVGIDDVVDAAAAAWSAWRIDGGKARSFPAVPTQTDRRKRNVVIWG